MTIFDITRMPQCIENNHESLTRAYWVLDLVTELLNERVPHAVILRIIKEIDDEARKVSAMSEKGMDP